MIINATYFKGNIYLPNAKNSISSTIPDVENKVLDFIKEYESDCLFKCFGSVLFNEFKTKLDDAVTTLIKAGADAKWGLLMNGETYTNPNGDEVVWGGIRRKTNSLGSSVDGEYDKSFLAQYVYFYHEKNAHIIRSGAGNKKINSANSVNANDNQKVVSAWREFIRHVQGETDVSPYFVKEGFMGGVGVDYYAGGNGAEVNLYQFINDKNELIADTYADFKPKKWTNLNNMSM
jgi:hypothetical protein